MLKHPVPKFRSDLSVHLRDIAEKQVPAKLKPIVGYRRRVKGARRGEGVTAKRST